MISAPGKLVLLGDYAVLEGGTAMVAAVNRRARGELVPASSSSSEVVRSVLELASPLAFDPERRSIAIDTSEFRDDQGRKLGLGSSAATAVLAASLALGRRDEAAFALAILAHRRATGGGSGVDVAASFHGGIIAARRQPGLVQPLASRLPGLHLFVLFTHQSSDTKELVERCQRAPAWSAHARGLSKLADEGLEAWANRDADRFLSVVARYGRAMAALGRDAGAPVVTEPIDAVMRLAGESDSAAKPSGAGGGDVVLGFSRDPELGARLADATGLSLVPLQVDPVGLRA